MDEINHEINVFKRLDQCRRTFSPGSAVVEIIENFENGDSSSENVGDVKNATKIPNKCEIQKEIVYQEKLFHAEEKLELVCAQLSQELDEVFKNSWKNIVCQERTYSVDEIIECKILELDKENVLTKVTRMELDKNLNVAEHCNLEDTVKNITNEDDEGRVSKKPRMEALVQKIFLDESQLEIEAIHTAIDKQPKNKQSRYIVCKDTATLQDEPYETVFGPVNEQSRYIVCKDTATLQDEPYEMVFDPVNEEEERIQIEDDDIICDAELAFPSDEEIEAELDKFDATKAEFDCFVKKLQDELEKFQAEFYRRDYHVDPFDMELNKLDTL